MSQIGKKWDISPLRLYRKTKQNSRSQLILNCCLYICDFDQKNTKDLQNIQRSVGGIFLFFFIFKQILNLCFKMHDSLKKKIASLAQNTTKVKYTFDIMGVQNESNFAMNQQQSLSHPLLPWGVSGGSRAKLKMKTTSKKIKN